MQTQCPVYVHREVWDKNHMEMGMLTQPHAPPPTTDLEQLTGTAALTTLR